MASSSRPQSLNGGGLEDTYATIEDTRHQRNNSSSNLSSSNKAVSFDMINSNSMDNISSMANGGGGGNSSISGASSRSESSKQLSEVPCLFCPPRCVIHAFPAGIAER